MEEAVGPLVPEVAVLREEIGKERMVWCGKWEEVWSEVLDCKARPASELARRRIALPCLRKADSSVWFAAVWSDGTSVAKASDAFNSIEDKADLAMALDAMSCDQNQIAPTTVILTAASDEESILKKLKKKNVKMILKPASGYGGEGIVLVNNVSDALAIIRQSEALAAELPFASEAAPQRYVLQEFIQSVLVNKRPCHLRTYAARVSGKAYIYVANHEVRIAQEGSFISNGLAGADRCLLSHVFDSALSRRLATFVATCCLSLIPDALPPTEDTLHLDDVRKDSDEKSIARVDDNHCFALAGIDVILDASENDLKLLEFNVNPACPTKAEVSTVFWQHLCDFASALLTLALDHKHSDFRQAAELISSANFF